MFRYSGFLSNYATIAGTSSPANNPNDPNVSNNRNGVGIVVQGADLEVEKTVDNATPYEGDTVDFTVTVTNHGPIDAD